jgi:two-component system, NtrC family, sensor kinase
MKQEALNGLKFLFLIISIAIGYIAMARLGLLYALNPGFATAFFPSSGLAVAALMTFGNTIWPGIFLGSMIANLVTSTPMISTSFFISLGIALGSTLQAITMAYILRKLTPANHLLSLHRNVLVFICTAVVCCLIASTIGIAVLFVAGIIPQDSLTQNWTTWWVGDIMGIWIFTPLILSWANLYSYTDKFKRRFEILFMIFICLAIGIICFGGWLENEYPLEYLLLPCLLWAIFRLKTPVVTFLLALVSFIALWGTSSGFGPFAQSSLNESLILLQLFLGVLTVMTLLLTSVLNELNHNSQVLEEFNQTLMQQNLELQEKNHSNKKP